MSLDAHHIRPLAWSVNGTESPHALVFARAHMSGSEVPALFLPGPKAVRQTSQPGTNVSTSLVITRTGHFQLSALFVRLTVMVFHDIKSNHKRSLLSYL